MHELLAFNNWRLAGMHRLMTGNFLRLSGNFFLLLVRNWRFRVLYLLLAVPHWHVSGRHWLLLRLHRGLDAYDAEHGEEENAAAGEEGGAGVVARWVEDEEVEGDEWADEASEAACRGDEAEDAALGVGVAEARGETVHGGGYEAVTDGDACANEKE